MSAIGSRLASAGAVLVLLAGGCMASEYAYLNSTPEMVQAWLDECENNPGDPLRRERYCTLAINSADAIPEDRAFALGARAYVYHQWGRFDDAAADLSEAIRISPSEAGYFENRGLAYAELGKLDLAEADFNRAQSLTGDARFAGLAENVEREREAQRQRELAEREARRRFALSYQGFWCGAIQKDSVFNAANEIKIQTFVSAGGGEAFAMDIPSAEGSYKNVRPGYRSSGGERTLWRGGGDEYVNLSVVMWEHDDGGDYVDTAVFYGLMAVAARGGGGAAAPRVGAAPRGAIPGQPMGVRHTPNIVEQGVSGVVKSLLGASNDHMGSSHQFDNDPVYMAETPPLTENGFRHHISTNHPSGGANCRAYFLFQETAPAGEN